MLAPCGSTEWVRPERVLGATPAASATSVRVMPLAVSHASKASGLMVWPFGLAMRGPYRSLPKFATIGLDRGRKAWTVEVPTCTDQARIDRYGQAMADLAANALGASDLTFYAADLAITEVER